MRAFRFTILFISLSVILLLPIGCKDEKQIEGPTIRPVRTLEVYSAGGTRTRTFSGISRAGMESNLSFKVSGTVNKVAVKVGDKVKKGALIAQLDNEDYNVQVQAAASEVAQAKAQLRNSEANYERIRGLYENNNASRSDLDSARASYDSSKASVNAIASQLQAKRLQLGYTKLKAPVDGEIAAVQIEANENVSTGQMVALLTSGTLPEVEVSVPEVLISQIKKGSEVKVKFDAIPDRDFNAIVTEVGVSSGASGATYAVVARLEKPDEAIRSGMTTEVLFTFVSSDTRERYFVPVSSVGEDSKGKFVYVSMPSATEPGFGTIKRKPVTTGELTSDGMEVLEGLEEGDHVVTAGVSKIRVGLKVKLSTTQ